MNFSLENHSRHYEFSITDGLFSVGTLFSGAPYAQRHWQLSKICDPTYATGHRLIALLEYIPVLGGLAALIERVAVLVHNRFFNHSPDQISEPLIVTQKPNEQIQDETTPEEEVVYYHQEEEVVYYQKGPSFRISNEDEIPAFSEKVIEKTQEEVVYNHVEPIVELTIKHDFTKVRRNKASPSLSPRDVDVVPEKKAENWWERRLSLDEAMAKMWKNSKKAIEEHAMKGSYKSYANCEQAVLSINNTPLLPLKLSHSSAENIGPREAMEDAHFYCEIEQGAIAGVLDGHGGKEVAELASKLFQEKFSEALSNADDNVYQAFTVLIHEIHEEIAKDEKLNDIGSTAVLCFIDKRTHLIYTATIADSEENIYREIQGQLKSIPLSCIRDWSSKKEAKRAAEALGKPEIEEKWQSSEKPKHLRFPSFFNGINVSRALGDINFTVHEGKPGLIHKPKMTVNQLQPGDRLILACDGLKDFVSEEEIIQNINSLEPNENLAEKLVNYAVKTNWSRDNVTVLVIDVT